MKIYLFKLPLFFIGLIFFSFLISCNKQVEEKVDKINVNNQQISFIQSLEEKGDNFSGILLINNKITQVDTFFYDESKQSDVNDISDTIFPILKKISQIDTEDETLTDESGNVASCKYCSSFGGVSCGKQIANQIPSDAGEVIIVVSKKDSKGCRTITAKW